MCLNLNPKKDEGEILSEMITKILLKDINIFRLN